ncbi:hypothetical protein [Sodalis-like endosymbiont of Proechinophthirus fluctus]|uniref:hypothetical protein n=1 Tax=Sodalis-like endosymbiont of Proechinophthirus fluctus TaxID=1462730 RepID=UPI00164FCC65|nr:hypothetical protein [Sodalis-like endosymbiont of Proechinophthirus fluctus]
MGKAEETQRSTAVRNTGVTMNTASSSDKWVGSGDSIQQRPGIVITVNSQAGGDRYNKD